MRKYVNTPQQLLVERFVDLAQGKVSLGGSIRVEQGMMHTVPVTQILSARPSGTGVSVTTLSQGQAEQISQIGICEHLSQAVHELAEQLELAPQAPRSWTITAALQHRPVTPITPVGPSHTELKAPEPRSNYPKTVNPKGQVIIPQTSTWQATRQLEEQRPQPTSILRNGGSTWRSWNGENAAKRAQEISEDPQEPKQVSPHVNVRKQTQLAPQTANEIPTEPTRETYEHQAPSQAAEIPNPAPTEVDDLELWLQQDAEQNEYTYRTGK